jgi:hypothetical protein
MARLVGSPVISEQLACGSVLAAMDPLEPEDVEEDNDE